MVLIGRLAVADRLAKLIFAKAATRVRASGEVSPAHTCFSGEVRDS